MNLRLWSLLYRSWWLGTPRSPPYKHVVQIGDPVLRQTASPVDPAQIRSLAMLKLYQNLYYLMKLTKSAGLAAPQIGVSLRLFAVQAPDQGIPLQGTPAYFTRNRAKVLAVQNVEEIPPPPDSEITIPGPLGERESTRRELEYSGGSDEDYLEDRSVDSLEVTDTSANTQLKSVIADVDLMKNTPNQIWVNPEMRVLDYKKLVGEECCQSMQGFAAHVPRHTSVLLTGLNEEGKEKKLEASGWAARLLQHEMDHLDGKFFTDSMVPRSLAMTNWDAVNHHQGRIYVTYTPKR